jgi:hypothetical protein
MYKKVSFKNLRRRDYLQDLVIDGGNIKTDLKETGCQGVG